MDMGGMLGMFLLSLVVVVVGVVVVVVVVGGGGGGGVVVVVDAIFKLEKPRSWLELSKSNHMLVRKGHRFKYQAAVMEVLVEAASEVPQGCHLA